MFLQISAICTGCGRQKRVTFTQTVYGEENGLTGSSGTERPEETIDSGETGESLICVFVCGAVVTEGVYYLPEKSRVIDAVNAAGGYREDADRVYVNQAEYVHDAERVAIPTLEEAKNLRELDEASVTQKGADAGQQQSSRININTASKTELMQIPGIGENKADRIISYRENHGRFGSPEEIKNISGIGDGVFEGLKDYITVE